MSEEITSEEITRTKRKFDPEDFKGRSHSDPGAPGAQGAKGVTSVEIGPIGRVLSLPVTETDMPEEERQAKIAEFEEWFIHFIEELEEDEDIEGESLDDPSIGCIGIGIDGKKLFYFIGRTNPPQEGHIDNLEQLVLTAYENGEKAFIFLSNGPKGKFDDNPLPFGVKEAIIRKHLTERLKGRGIENPDNLFEIINTQKPIDRLYVESELRLPDLTLYHFAGDKDDDTTKLNYVETSIKKKFPEHKDNIKLVTVSVVPTKRGDGEPMSGTTVRDFARSNNQADFQREYGLFYRDNTETVFDYIRNPFGKRGGRKTKKSKKYYKKSKKSKKGRKSKRRR
jgi:hypothetical protein